MYNVVAQNEQRSLPVTGYTDSRCSTDVDECRGSPCQNGGACVDGVGRFTCVCPPGFEDPVCGTNIDDCASNPCRNGATCTDIVQGYRCQCTSGRIQRREIC